MRLKITIFLNICSLVALAQPTLNKVYETGSIGITIIPEQNGYFIGGVGYSSQFNNWYAVKLYRVDSFGTVLWEKDYGESGHGYESPASGGAKKTIDGGYIIPGKEWDSSTGITSAFLINVDSIGNIVWMDTFSGSNYNGFNDVVETADKGFAIIGETENTDTNGNMYLVKVDSNGNLLWQKQYGGNQEDAGIEIGLLDDGGFILSGLTFSYGPGTSSNYLIRTDSLGTVLWSKTYGTNQGQNGQCQAQPDKDGGFLMFGTWDSVSNNLGPNYVAKLDSGGNIKWITFVNDSIALDQARELSNENIIAVGQKDKPPGAGYFYEGYITQLDSNGGQLWEKLLLYTGPGIDTSYDNQTLGTFYDFQLTSDNGIALTGTADFVDTLVQSIQEIWLVKIGCVNDCDTVGIAQVSEPNANLKIYPNPAYSSVIIEWQANGASEATVVIYDMLGRVVSSQQISSGKAEVNVSGLEDGLYVVRVLGNDGEVLGNSKLAVVR